MGTYQIIKIVLANMFMLSSSQIRPLIYLKSVQSEETNLNGYQNWLRPQQAAVDEIISI